MLSWYFPFFSIPQKDSSVQMACELLFPRHAEKRLTIEEGKVIDFDKALGVHVQALDAYSQRAKILASNIVNSDTPGFKARDIDFRSVLAQKTNQSVRLETTEFDHMSDPGSVGTQATLMYRTPMQPSLDGNTVDSQTEIAAFSENAMRYQATLQFLSGKFKGMIAALRGE